MSQLVKMNKAFGQYLKDDCFEKLLQSLYPCHQTIETEEHSTDGSFSSNSTIKCCSIIDSIETWGEQTRIYFWRYLTVASHKLQEAKKFLRNLGQFKCVTRETRYHVSIAELLIRNPRPKLQNYSEDLVPKISKLIDWGSHRGGSHRGTWTGCSIGIVRKMKVGHWL